MRWRKEYERSSQPELVSLHSGPCAEVMGSNPVRAWIFFRSYFNYWFSSVHSCEDRLYSFLHHSAHIWFSYIYSHHSPLGWFIWIQHNDQLPVGLLVQLVERCTVVAQVMSSNPVRPEFFSGLVSTTSSVVFIATRIAYVSLFTAVHICQLQ